MLKVSQSTINLQEDGTEVLPEEEATSTKPAPEGTENPFTYNQLHALQSRQSPTISTKLVRTYHKHKHEDSYLLYPSISPS